MITNGNYKTIKHGKTDKQTQEQIQADSVYHPNERLTKTESVQSWDEKLFEL